MKRTEQQRKYKDRTAVVGIMATLLFLCVLATTAVVFYRLEEYTPDTEWKNVITLVPASPAAAPEGYSDVLMHRTSGTMELGSVVDDTRQEVFRNHSQAEIFRLTYAGTDGHLTVCADGENKVIAPGTANTYTFTLKNTADMALNYEMSITAQVIGTELTIPVQVRLWDYEGNYLLGDENKRVPFLQMDGVRVASSLEAGYGAIYTLEWLWPFEQGNDEYDTMLGNMAVEDDIVLAVHIDTVATAIDAKKDDSSEDESSEGSIPSEDPPSSTPSSTPSRPKGIPPKTGETDNKWPLYLMAGMSVTIILCIMMGTSGKKNGEDT